MNQPPVTSPLEPTPAERAAGLVALWQVRFGVLTVAVGSTHTGLQMSGSYAGHDEAKALAAARESLLWRLANYRKKIKRVA